MNLKEILTPPKNIAVVGISDNPERPSYRVAHYLKEQGFNIIPVNPMIQHFLGILAYPSISAIPAETHIDVVDIFRRSEEVLKIVEEVIASGRKPVIWMQEGVISREAKKLAEENDMTVVMDKCMMKMHRSFKIV